MISDYHVHTEFSGDSREPAAAQIEMAVQLGMDAVCFTDHHDFEIESEIDFTLDLDRYFEELRLLREQYADRIRVKIGAEMGLQPHLKGYIGGLAQKYPFDFIIGSTHFVNRADPFYPAFFQGRSEREAYLEYFEAVLDNTKAVDDYDVIGHLDYVVRYGPNRNKFYSYDVYRDILDEILSEAVKRGKGLECNTSAYRKGLGQPNPHPDILKRYRELGGELVTIGSDAHMAKDLGADFKKAADLLLSCGFQAYATFSERKPSFHAL